LRRLYISQHSSTHSKISLRILALLYIDSSISAPLLRREPIHRRARSLSPANKLGLLSLIGATYFMVSGGPYGLEDIIGSAGYTRALLLLAVIPLIWSLPTSLMVGELASAIPDEGGYYVWVRRAMGRFWGFQEAWLSLAASVFDMALYPVTFVLYLGHMPYIGHALTSGYRGTAWALAVVVGCALWNLSGAKAVGQSSVVLFCVLFAPFILMAVVAFWKWHAHGSGALLQPVTSRDMATAISVCLWNYMGWDNASTVAQEVDDPQRNYPRAMLGACAAVAFTYMLPVLAVGLAGLAAGQFSSGANDGTGTWAVAAGAIVGPVAGLGVVLGGMINGVGMFNPLMMSYSRLPIAMAEDGLMPKIFLRVNRRAVPWVSIIFCAMIWALALGLPFAKLISIDLVLYGSSLLLEFIALVVLRRREPALHRPFRVPGGIAGAVAVGIGPLLLIAYAIYAARNEQVLNMNALLFAALVGAAGVFVYFVAGFSQRRANSNRASTPQ
jgi:amino acid transporter